MNQTFESGPTAPRPSAALYSALAAVLVLAFLARANFAWDGCWQQPYEVHHLDEAYLPYEALSLWEGVTPRELGWPASTTRLLLSGCYAVDMALCGPSLSSEGKPKAAGIMDAVAEWTRARWEDPRRLFLIGRWLSAVIGLAQVAVTFWAVRRWLSPTAGLLAALMAALAPVAVSHSQFVLVDMTGVLFTTWLMGLVAKPASRPGPRALGTGALLGLAVASKYHLGIWLLPAVLCLWQDRNGDQPLTWRERLKYTAWLLLACGGVYLLLVPWAWTNPVLILKEFLHTVASKMSSGDGPRPRAVDNLNLVFLCTGWLTLAGLLPGLLVAPRRLGWRGVPVLLVFGLGSLAVARAGEVYDRHGLLVFPALLLISAAGLAWPLERLRGLPQAGVACAVLLLAALTGWQLVEAQRFAGQVDTYGRAHAWLQEHLRAGDRVAVDSLYPHRLQRTREQLAALVAERLGPDAYARKMRTNDLSANPAHPMRQAVLTDEFYDAHWYQRELSGRKTGEGFKVTFYEDQPRFNSILTSEAVAEFKEGLKDPRRGYDYLLLARKADLGVQPAAEFKDGPGPRLYLFVRPREAAASESGP